MFTNRELITIEIALDNYLRTAEEDLEALTGITTKKWSELKKEQIADIKKLKEKLDLNYFKLLEL